MNPEAERIRIKYLYRSLVLKGKVQFCPEVARKIVGPDCAYHLYSRCGTGPAAEGKVHQFKGMAAKAGRRR